MVVLYTCKIERLWEYIFWHPLRSTDGLLVLVLGQGQEQKAYTFDSQKVDHKMPSLDVPSPSLKDTLLGTNHLPHNRRYKCVLYIRTSGPEVFIARCPNLSLYVCGCSQYTNFATVKFPVRSNNKGLHIF